MKYFLALLIILQGLMSHSQNFGDFRSMQSGSWNDVNSWERWDGTNWIPATTYPNSPNANVQLFGSDTIQIGTSVTAGYLRIQRGCLMLGGGSPVINNIVVAVDGSIIGHSDLTIAGDFVNDGNISLSDGIVEFSDSSIEWKRRESFLWS